VIRRGMTLMETWVLLLALAALSPVVVTLGVESLRSLRAPEAAQRLWSLDATVDDLRRALAVHGWRIEDGAVVVGAHRWSSRDGSLFVDGDLHRRDCRLEAAVDDAGWLRLVLLDRRHGERVVAAPSRQDGR